MSLSKLPDLLKSKICSFLDFQDVKKLEQINKKTQYFLKKYKMDKPKVYELFIHQVDEFIECSVTLEDEGDFIHLPAINYKDDVDVHSAKILELIQTFHFIDDLEIQVSYLNEELSWDSVKTKIGCVEFSDCNMDLSDINDKLFSVFYDNRTTLLFTCMDQLEVAVTDATLDTLTKMYLPVEIKLDGLTTDFTFGRIKTLIEAALRTGMPNIDWDFGILKKEQFDEAQRFANGEFQEMIGRLKIPLFFKHENDTADDLARKALRDKACYIIKHRKIDQENYYIHFAVKKPEELIMAREVEDSDDEDEEMEDDGDEESDEDESDSENEDMDGESAEENPMDD